MDFRDVTKLAIRDYSQQLEHALDGLTPHEMRWQPDPACNHILWTLWHIGRNEDGWCEYLSGQRQLWVSGGWSKRIGLPDEALGVGDTPEQVAAFPDVDVALVSEYRRAACERLLDSIDTLAPADLDRSFPDRSPFRPRPAPTVAWVLARIPVEVSQHTGQIAYLRGMQQGIDWR